VVVRERVRGNVLKRKLSQISKEEKEQELVKQRAKKLYVGNLPKKTTMEDIIAFFGPVGEVKFCNTVRQRAKNEPAYSFVTMESEEIASKAIVELNGKLLCERAVKVMQLDPGKKK